MRVVDEIAPVHDGLALRQALGRHPHGLGLDLEQFGIGQDR
jgi:hypothetical protein